MRPAKTLGLERAVEALVLAMALRMIRRAVQRRHAMLDQPYAEPGQPPFPGVAPRAAVVSQHEQGQAIALKRRLQGILHRLMALVVGRLQPHRIARMIVDDRQRMQLSPPHRHLALEVHLPQHVGLGMLEALPSLLPGRHQRHLVAPQDPGDGRRRGRHDTLPRQRRRDLATAPRRFSRQTSSTAASSSRLVRRGEWRGRRERSDSPATPSSR